MIGENKYIVIKLLGTAASQFASSMSSPIAILRFLRIVVSYGFYIRLQVLYIPYKDEVWRFCYSFMLENGQYWSAHLMGQKFRSHP